MSFPTFKKINEVVIDGHAALRIIKHCNDNESLVAGILLGIDIGETLHVTYAFAYPNSSSINEGDAVANAYNIPNCELNPQDYQIKMLSLLNDVNIDNHSVGWYQSMSLNHLYTQDVINYHYNFQSRDSIGNSIFIIYDQNLSSKRGELVLKAYRLNDKFMNFKKKANPTTNIKTSEIFDEIPLKIKNSGLSSAFLYTLKYNKLNITSSSTNSTANLLNNSDIINCNYDLLSMINTEACTNNYISFLNSTTNDLLAETNKLYEFTRNNNKLRKDYLEYVNSQRNAKEGEKFSRGDIDLSKAGLEPYPEFGSRMETLMLMGQTDSFANTLHQHVTSSTAKLSLLTKLNTTN